MSGLCTIKEINTYDILDFKEWWPRKYKNVSLSDEKVGIDIPKLKKMVFNCPR